MRQASSNRRTRTLLPVIVVLFWFAQYIYIPYQTPFLTGLGLSSTVVGVIVGVYGFSQMVLRLPVGVSADRAGRHRGFIAVGCLAACAASVLRVTLYDGVGFLLGNVFSGLASAMWISFMVRYTSFYSAEDQQKGMARIVLYNNAGMLLGFVVGTLLYGRTSMRLLCLLAATAGAVAAVLALLMEKEPVPATRRSTKELLPICANRRLIFFSVLAVVQQGVQMSTTMSFTNQVLTSLGAGSGLVGCSSVFYMLCAVGCASLASGSWIRRVGAGRMIPISFVLVAVYCALVPTVGSIPVVFALQMLPGVSTGMLFSMLTTEAMREVPAWQKSTAMGFYQAVYAIGMTLLPMVTGAIASASGMSTGYFVLGGMALLSAAAAVLYMRRT